MTIIDRWGQKVILRSARVELFGIIEKYMSLLSPRDYIIAKLYYGFGFTDEEIGAVARTSHQNINKIRKKIIRRITRMVAKLPSNGGS